MAVTIDGRRMTGAKVVRVARARQAGRYEKPGIEASLATPDSIDSIPGKSNADDHVSSSAWCARKARTVVENVEQIVAVEMLMAAQALSLVADRSKDYPVGKGPQAALETIRAEIAPALDGDRWYHHEMQSILELARNGRILAAVEAAVGGLE